MHTRILPFILGCLAIMLFYSCKSNVKTVTCPSFNDTAYGAWFPYVDSQKLVYKDSLGSSDTITIGYAIATSAYTVQATTASPDSCTSSVVIYSSQKTNNGSAFKFLTQDYATALGQDSITLYFYSLAFTSGRATDTGLNISNLAPTIHSQTFTNYSLRGKTYSKLQVISTNDTTVTSTALPWIYKLYLSYGQGIIAYETFPQKDIWVLQ